METDIPRQFSRPRQQRTKGFNVKFLRQFPQPSSKKARPFPISEEEFASHKKGRLEDLLLAHNLKSTDQNHSRSMSPEIRDPKTLCPFCDRIFPADPSPKLVLLLETALNHSYRDPRPNNALGRKALLGVYITMCTRHVFEQKLLPEAITSGWPTFIDWSSVGPRVEAMRGPLESIIRDPGRQVIYGREETEVHLEDMLVAGPRMECVFWQEVVEELEASGSRHVGGIAGQFSTFEKAQPGYYGELGFMIMIKTLYRMFPDNIIDADTVQPFTLREFLGRILVPEVGMRLIMQDMGLDDNDPTSKQKAIGVLRASVKYGVSMFEDNDNLNVNM
ncbi:RTC4-like domain-containing protein [Mycena alexandri]|uniref:Restriction of telomere capping protein 4 n=1 Tax=Mycena alexandri TaxID=1745969 RepID=A0AAD6T692_9AGAR|nr:RTC4-like domain-containing protein [Mycena alexandri]KAJ7039265.1 RTC4-like domain-containing protein [Mycena alexandri]